MEDVRDTTMPDGHQQSVNRVREAMARRGLSLSDGARQTGLGASVISAVLSGSYRGRSDLALAKLNRWAESLDVVDRLNLGVDRAREFVETPTSYRVDDLCGFVKARGVIGMVAGATGTGKSMTFKQYEASNPQVWYCQFSAAHDSLAKVIRHIADAVGVYSSSTRGSSPIGNIVNQVRRTRGLLILDEAQHLSLKALETARSIFDQSEDDDGRTIGMVLGGHLDLAEKVMSLDHLDGRVGRRLVLTSATEADAEALCDHWEVTCPRGREYFRHRARDKGGLRRIAKVYEVALMVATREGVPVSIDHVRTAWASFSGSAAN